MRRTMIVLATAALLGGVVAASPATAVAKKGPQLGSWTCSDAASAPLASLELFKGNKYAVDGGDKAKYVYKTGQQKLKFKTGDYADTYYGVYDLEAKTLTLQATADDSVWATCTYGEIVVEPEPEPEPEPQPEPAPVEG